MNAELPIVLISFEICPKLPSALTIVFGVSKIYSGQLSVSPKAHFRRFQARISQIRTVFSGFEDLMTNLWTFSRPEVMEFDSETFF